MQRNTSSVIGLSHRTLNSLRKRNHFVSTKQLSIQTLEHSSRNISSRCIKQTNVALSRAINSTNGLTNQMLLSNDQSLVCQQRQLNTDSASVVGTEPDRNSEDFIENEQMVKSQNGKISNR